MEVLARISSARGVAGVVSVILLRDLRRRDQARRIRERAAAACRRPMSGSSAL
jgi:hypothetical protein